MTILFDSIILLILFLALGWLADYVVKHIKYISAILHAKLFAFGILLGLVTSLPEISLGINATIDKAATLSVGNLLGGIIVMLGLILGVSLMLNKRVKTDGDLRSLLPTVVVIFVPIILGFDGKYSIFDGLLMIGAYFGLIFYLYRLNYQNNPTDLEHSGKNKVTWSIIAVVVGVIGVLLVSHWIVKITLDLLTMINISKLFVGLVIFSIGTNLPEISIALASWRKKSSELSLSHLVSSSFTNVLLLGLLASFNTINFQVNISYWLVAIFMFLLLILFSIFYYTGKKLSRNEGFILVFIYLLFLVSSIVLGNFEVF